MGKRLFAGSVLALAVLLCACTNEAAQTPDTIAPTYEEPYTEATVPEATIKATEATVPETTAPEHTALYLPDVTTQQMLEYFEEVVLHMEYTDGTGNTSLVQKWIEPIRYRIYGDATEEDLAVLNGLFAQLNEIPGFPGIAGAGDEEPENLNISFLEPEDFTAAFSDILNGEDAYGGTQFWYYTATNEIYTANIGYRTDIDQSTRTSILIEEIINTLGISDTVLRTNSVVYQYSNENTALSNVDWVIVNLLYNPQIQCGMGIDECNAVVEELYS